HVEVGHGGHFLGSMHTMERFRTCFHRPFLSSSDNFDKWTRNGSLDTNRRAEVVYKKKLEEYEAPPIDAGIKEELERYVIRRRAELGD
ncbi:MAG: trimethylamine methyltransferase family protein, partial [Aeromicrobium sp.]